MRAATSGGGRASASSSPTPRPSRRRITASILLDSLQSGDEPAYDGILERFPQNYHEPYYRSYLEENFPAIARQSGLTHRRNVTTFVSKVMVFDKPAT